MLISDAHDLVPHSIHFAYFCHQSICVRCKVVKVGWWYLFFACAHSGRCWRNQKAGCTSHLSRVYFCPPPHHGVWSRIRNTSLCTRIWATDLDSLHFQLICLSSFQESSVNGRQPCWKSHYYLRVKGERKKSGFKVLDTYAYVWAFLAAFDGSLSRNHFPRVFQSLSLSLSSSSVAVLQITLVSLLREGSFNSLRVFLCSEAFFSPSWPMGLLERRWH